MKVLHYNKNFGKTTLTFIYNIVWNLSQMEDCEVKFLTHNRENEKEFPFNNVSVVSDIQWKEFERRLRFYLRKYNLHFNLSNRAFSQNICKIIDDYNPDVIHCHFGNNAIKLIDNLNSELKSKFPIFIHFHGYDASRMLYSKIYINRLKKIFQQKNIHPIVVSEFMYKALVDKGLPIKKKRILYCGIDIHLFHRKNRENKKTQFLQVSSFREKKGHFYTIHAFNELLKTLDNSKKYTLTLAGSGPCLEESKKLVYELDLQDYIHFPGTVSHSETKALMEEADFFVHHSITDSNGDQEGIPTVIMEAMSMELPVISTYHTGIPELVEDGVNGYLVEEHDIKTYAAKMRSILEWDYQYENRKKVEKYFSTNVQLKTLLNFYNEAM